MPSVTTMVFIDQTGKRDNMELISKEAYIARQEGRYDDAVRILTGLFDQIDSGALEIVGNHFITMFEWSLLVEEYPPARQALASIRDEQVRRLRDGQVKFGRLHEKWPSPSRFNVIVEMDDILNDMRSTYELFVHLTSFLPSLAKREAHIALPAIIAAGDFALADTYLDDPMDRLRELNRMANELPLNQPLHGAPRLGAEFSNFMGDVRMRAAILDGLGRSGEAELLRNGALAGLANDEMRELGVAELTVPGSINRELTSRQIELEEAADKSTAAQPQRSAPS